MKNILNNLIFAFIIFLSNNSFSQGDEKSNALVLSNLSNYISNSGLYTNENASATNQGVCPLASCWTDSTESIDVWFKFISVGSDVMITVNGLGISSGSTLKEPSLALYLGTNPTLTELKCSKSINGNNMNTLLQGGLSLATTYFIRVTTTIGNKGKFDLSINNINTVLNNNSPNDCDKGTIICNKDVLSVGLSNSFGTNTTEHQLPGSCMISPEANSTWLEFKCSATGTLDFEILGSNMAEDLDWILMEIPDVRNCATKTLVSCNIASCDINGSASTSSVIRRTGMRTGEDALGLIGSGVTADSEGPGCNGPANGFNNTVSITSGKTYALFVNNFTGAQGFSIAWGGTSKFQGPELNLTVDKTVICIGESVVASASSSNVGSYSILDWILPSSANPTSSSGIGPLTVTFNQTGIYPIILKGEDAQGCVNVVHENITVGGLDSIININTCDTYSLNGQDYTQSGTFYQIIPKQVGCDSLITLNLTIAPINGIISKNDTIFTCSNSNVTYQWINCDTKAPIYNAVNQLYKPITDGSYAVIVSSNNCSDTSNCQLFTMKNTTGLNSSDLIYNSFRIFPNPTFGEIVLISDQENTLYSVTNVIGEELMQINLKGKSKFDISHFENGIYFVKNIHSNQFIRIIKQ